MLTRELMPGVHLRLFEESDAAELHAVIEAEREALAPWMAWASTQTLDDTIDHIRATRRRLADDDGMETAIVADGRIVGSIGALAVNRRVLATELGYWLASGAQGRGVMTAAVRAFTEHAFGAWDLHRVQIQCAVDNVRSRAIPERLGFALEGTRRDAERVGERWHDLAVYGALSTEWSG